MYRLINRTIDLLTGFDIKTELEQVLGHDTWTREQIVDNQEKQFSKLSAIASRSDYYKHYKGKKLEEFPVMNREKLKSNYDRLKTNFRKPYKINNTSGSTNSPISFALSKEMLLAKRVSHQKMLHWFGLNREDPEFKIGGIRMPFKTKVYYVLKNKRYVDSFAFSKSNTAKLIRLINRFKPKILYGYPSAIDQLIKYAKLKDITLHQPVIVVTHAENLYKEIIENIKDAFPDTKIVNQYWASETNIAVTCPEGRLHMDEDTVICEVINKDENGIGDLLVTNLYSYDFPIIRYMIGDRVKLSQEMCPCGRKSMVFDSIYGREIEFIDLPDGRKVPLTALYLSKYGTNVLSYQIVYHKDEALWDILYIPLDKSVTIRKDKIIDYVHTNFGLDVKFTQVDHIELTKGGKFKKLLIA